MKSGQQTNAQTVINDAIAAACKFDLDDPARRGEALAVFVLSLTYVYTVAQNWERDSG